jgi:hypothetical protein
MKKIFTNKYTAFTSGILLLLVLGLCAYYFGWDKKFTTILLIIVGFVTQIGGSILALIAAIPLIGPLVVKIVTLPFFIMINGASYLTTFATLKTSKKEIFQSRILATVLCVGILIGFILGKLL